MKALWVETRQYYFEFAFQNFWQNIVFFIPTFMRGRKISFKRARSGSKQKGTRWTISKPKRTRQRKGTEARRPKFPCNLCVNFTNQFFSLFVFPDKFATVLHFLQKFLTRRGFFASNSHIVRNEKKHLDVCAQMCQQMF